ncbi:hypothetical protein [Tsukamurella sp. NPDC003166]|uniref:hypothetical protein n=1 Tax=Tsukamurella sp. NPDC003166 TaxID=3154444 RepID=UPI0033B98F81
MNISRKTLAAAGFLALSAAAFTPAIASADSGVHMYHSCSASQEGRDATDVQGTAVRCVQTSSGTGYDWEVPN